MPDAFAESARHPGWVEAAHHHLLRADPPLAALVARQGPVTREIPAPEDYFGRLVRAIVGQQISGKAAASIFGRVAAAAGVPLTPEGLHALSDDALRACGLSQAKLRSVHDLAAHAIDGRLDLAHLQTLPDAAVTAQLVAVRGIGKWTADMFLMFALGRPDVLPAEDLGIQNAVERLYRLDAHPTPAVVRRLAAEGRWHPYTTAACFHLWDSLR